MLGGSWVVGGWKYEGGSGGSGCRYKSAGDMRIYVATCS